MNIRLKWLGAGKYAGIVMIATRDLTDYDLETYMARDGITEQELIDELCAGGLYEICAEFICDTCGKPCKTAQALIKHELKHIAKSMKKTEEGNDHGSSRNSIKETNTDRE